MIIAENSLKIPFDYQNIIMLKFNRLNNNSTLPRVQMSIKTIPCNFIKAIKLK